MDEMKARDADGRRAWLREAIGSLAPGATLEVSYPTEALAELRDLGADVPGIEWYPLELREADTVIELVPCAPGSADRRAVIAFMGAEHRHVHRLLGLLRKTVAQGERADASAALGRLSTLIHRHFTMEEELLLPIIARRLISPRGPAAVLRDEHLRILAHLHGVEASLGLGDLGAASQALGVLEAFLGRHAAMEDQVLYAITDGLLTDVERAAVVAECQRVEIGAG